MSKFKTLWQLTPSFRPGQVVATYITSILFRQFSQPHDSWVSAGCGGVCPWIFKILKILKLAYTGCPRNNGTVDTVDFSGICSDQVIFFTLLDRASSSHYINTNIIKFGWELSILWVISYGLSSSKFARFPEFRGTMTN